MTLSREEGATNITWFFHADTAYYYAPQAGNEMRWYYPGDDYVDWLATSLYAFPKSDGAITSFGEKLQTYHDPSYVGSYAELTALGSRPLAIVETGFNKVSDQHTRATWIADAAATLQGGAYPRVKGLAWYLVPSGDFEDRPDSSPEFNAAFRRAFAPSFFGPSLKFTGDCRPDTPTNLVRRRRALRWSTVPNAAGYEIYRGTKLIGTTPSAFFVIGNAIGVYRVRSVSPTGRSPFAVSH